MEFADLLLAQVTQRSQKNSRLVKGLIDGTFTRQALAIFARRWVLMAESAIQNIGVILSYCPTPDQRLHMIQNFMDEEGMFFDPNDNELKIDPSRRHVEMAKCFSRALGVTDEDIADDTARVTSQWQENHFN